MRNRSVTIWVMLVVCVMAVANIASATVIRGIDIEFVTIGNAGNLGDTRAEANPSGCGAVSYEYRIGKYEITAAQWQTINTAAGIGDPGNWDGDQPVAAISWYEAAQFCNYLTTGDKSQGVYQFSGDNVSPGDFLSILDHENAVTIYGTAYFLPTEDERYKAAYYTGSSYSTYANGTGIAPIAGVETNYDNVFDHPWDIGSGTIEQNGTFDMMGNVWEWNEAATETAGFSRGTRAGAYHGYDYHPASSYRGDAQPGQELGGHGFRVACIITVPPIADAGEDIVADANEDVVLDASSSTDPDGHIVQYIWTALPEEEVLYSGDQSFFTTRALGRVEEVIKLTVVDDDGLSSEDTVSIFNRRVEDIELTPGPEGPQGIQGEQGPQGPAGEQGPPGITPEEIAQMQAQITALQQANTALLQQIQLLEQQNAQLLQKVEENRYLLEQLPQLRKQLEDLVATVEEETQQDETP